MKSTTYIKLEIEADSFYSLIAGSDRVCFEGNLSVGIDLPKGLVKVLRDEAKKRKKGYSYLASRMIGREIVRAIKSFEAQESNS